MTIVGFLIGIAIFLMLGFLCLILLWSPYSWFKAFLELEEIKEKQRRESYHNIMEKFQNQIEVDSSWVSPYKDSKRKGISRLTENELVVESKEWFYTWGVFLVLEGFWAFSLYNGFKLVMQDVGVFLDENFFNA